MSATTEGIVPALAPGWRERAWDRLGEPWDLVVIGGGITGAGIARRAAHAGLRVLLLEQRDLGWGTSSRSSKLVHGGLRYLAHGQIGVVRDSVRERERLLRAAPGLVEELGFLMPTYRGARPGRWMYAAGLTAYDLLAGRRTHRHQSVADLAMLAPRLRTDGLTGGYRFTDAQTDDARLTLRVALEAVAAGATVVTYARVDDVLRDLAGTVVGVTVRDVASGPAGAAGRPGPAGTAGPAGATAEVRATAVIGATGAWADRLRGRLERPPRIRPLRGSHLLFPSWRLPLAQAVGISHPADGRPVFLFPWEGTTLVGTTDVDHGEDLDLEPRISPAEVAYFEEALDFAVPSLGVRGHEAVASFAGVRPVVGTGRADPSEESRDYAVWDERGLLTVTGGKLTTFDAIARDALGAIRGRFAGRSVGHEDGRAEAPVDAVAIPTRADLPVAARDLGPHAIRRLAGRLGRATTAMLGGATADDLEPVPGLPDTWAEIGWAARAEGVVHLDDLLLRRVRLGLRIEGGAERHLERVGDIVRPALGWDRQRWDAEAAAYLALWADGYAPPTPPGGRDRTEAAQ